MTVQNFIKKLIKLVELERNAEISAMIDEIKRLSGEEREKKGRAILGLNGKFVGEELGYFLVRFGRRREIDTEISVGDLVLISKGNPLKSDYTGTVVEKGTRFITIAVDRLPPWKLKNIRVDLFASDITFRRQIENLRDLSPEGKRVLEFLLGKREPKDSQKESFTPLDEGLNDSQREAISFALGSSDFFLVHGPFGTGKTRTLVEYIVQEVKRGKKILVTAESNLAVDNLVERLWGRVSLVRIGHPSRVSVHLKESTLAHQIESSEEYAEVMKMKEKLAKLVEKRDKFTKPSPQWRRGLSDEKILEYAEKNWSVRGVSREKIKEMAEWIKLNDQIRQLRENIEEREETIANKIVRKSQVVLSTNSSSALEIIAPVLFDVVVVDEASQATIPSILIPISKGKKFVLAGDHKQLPPTILSEEAKDLSRTLFEELIKKYPEKSVLLDTQYRMNELLMEFPSTEFYDGELKADESVKHITLLDLGVEPPNFGKFWDVVLSPKNVLVFIDTSKNENRFERQRKDSPSKENPLEAEIVKEIVEKLLSMGVKKEWIGVITPYDDQVDLIKSLVDEKVEVHSVDGFQGREKEVIIISFVRSNKKGEIGFLEDLRRFNVSLTRAKRKLITVGDSKTLSKHSTYRRFIEFVKKKGTYVTF
ncbi:IGHMBP2 family helicase [Thermotoga sp. KOL6]|uniref:IGHMBP2 family helicase n=1 Tax=Thermotoga sp. KOL6 TaxID=126741 RepID=UPI000C786006|nr:IGHMBP2 family helicase [Thermotoga sp. KOL6]PLV58061.1 AAA family ATPase [Thermotoga sp. KOL6]